jgi:hypothetical protein
MRAYAHHNKAATKIQAAFRGYLYRQQLFAPKDLPTIRRLCDGATVLNFFCPEISKEIFCRATSGKTPVYLPKNREDLVIKLCERSEALKRYHLSFETRKIVIKLGLKTLLIPQSRLVIGGEGPCLVEERISSISSDSKHNTNLYYDNLKLFTQLARDCTRLFCVLPIRGLVCRKRDSATNRIVLEKIRFDNFPFILEKSETASKGHVGLIDLERIRPFRSQHDLKDLFKIFPYHEKEILEEIQDSGIILKEKYKSEFRIIAKTWKKAYRSGSGSIVV